MTVDDETLAAHLRLLELGDRRAAVTQVLALHRDGAAPEALALQLLAPALDEVGRRWQQARWTVAQEHRATSITQAALAALATAADTVPDKPEVVVACVEGEWHTLAAELLGHVLAWRGWDVTFLGPSMPAAHLEQHLDAEPPFALVLSCTLPSNLVGALASLEAARVAGVPCVAGGRASGSDGARAEWLGASGWAATPDAADALLRAWLADGTPAAPRSQADLDALRFLADRPSLVTLAMALLHDRFPPMAGYSPDQLARTREDLGYIVDFAASAQLVADPRLLSDFVLWLRQVLESRGVPGAAAVVGFEVLHEAAEEAHPFAAELLAAALPLLPDDASDR